MALEGKKLVRSQQNKVLAGVAGGLAAHFNVDPILIRIAFVLLALADGVGVIAYLVAWALIPKEGELRSPAEAAVERVSGDPHSRNNTWIWVVILSVVGVLILASMGRWDWDAGVVIWALVLIGAGVWLYRQDDHSRQFSEAGPPPPPPPAPIPSAPAPIDMTPAVIEPAPLAGPVAAAKRGDTITEPAGNVAIHPSGRDAAEAAGGADSPRTLETDDPTAPRLEASAPGSPTTTLPLTGVATTRTDVVRHGRPVASRKPSSHLGRYTFAVALLLLGIAAVLENAGTVELSALQYGGLALLTIGSGLLVGTFWGRSRLLILAGLLLLPIFLLSGVLGSWFDVPFDAGAGEKVYAPGSPAEVRDRYELMAGVLNFDMTEMTWSSGPVKVDASVGFGEVNVLVPEGVSVDVKGRATVGAVSVPGDARAGFGVNVDITDVFNPGDPQLILDLKAFAGQVEVARALTPARGL